MKTVIAGIACAVGLAGLLSATPVFQERGGIVAIEAESTSSRLGDWEKKTDVADYSGECHLEFTGNKPENGPPRSPLTYEFTVTKPGKYTLTIRARKRLESKRPDISNDCYVAMRGAYEAGGGAPKSILAEDTKMFGGSADGWGWTRMLDFHHKKQPAIYDLRAGETYELVISGRSKNFNIDRILLVHESRDLRDMQRKNPPESITTAVTAPESAPNYLTRTLRNKAGKTITAQLVDKQGDTVVLLVRGKRYEIKIDTLSEGDQEFIEDWDPNEQNP